LTKPLSLQEIERLYIQGDRDLHQGRYSEAIATFEQLLQIVDTHEGLYFNIQRNLIKAYEQNQQLEQAIALCKFIADSDIASNALWGQNYLKRLSPNEQKPIAEPESELNINAVSTIQPKTLAEFKQYCEANLLEHLKTLECKRKSTLRTIFISAIICLILTWCISFSLSYWIRANNSLLFYVYCLILPASAWVIFCRGCIYNYKIGFKRNIVENIVEFISDRDRQLNYAAHLFIENKRQTIMAFTRSQILRDEIAEPDYLEQEDCVYGTIGDTNIFFAEILAENRKGGYLDEFGSENYRHKSVLFRGLFFEARFAKNFVSRTFVLPNDIKGKISLLHNWRGELIKLEDPEFERIFRVYGDSQTESRYILSTNLMSRLVDFNHKAGRKVYLSFVDGFLYVAIPYRHNLFEPRLFNSMMSFTPLKEYFQDLQLMIGIVEDLNLNRRIWQ
jgi:tetratricopeptide (TPR) repeat protein